MICLKLVKSHDDDAPVNNDMADLMHGAQVALYLVKPWECATPARVVCTDSYFASVPTLDALNEHGFKFIGIIKTATRTESLLDNVELNERGDSRHLVRLNVQGAFDMVAMVWVD